MKTPEHLRTLSFELIAAADAAGLVVTIERVPGAPLATGRAHSVVEFRPRRNPQSTVMICEGYAITRNGDKTSAWDFHEKVNTPDEGVVLVPMDGRKIALLLDNR